MSSGCEAASASRIGSTIRKITMSTERVSESVRSTLLSFSNFDRQQYAPQSGEIIGILMPLKDEMSAHLSAAQEAEGERRANQAGLGEAKEELVTSMAFIEATLTRQVHLVVEVGSLRNDIAETKRSLAADQELDP